MAKTGLLAFLLVFFHFAIGQKVQYSHQNIKKPNGAAMQLVANIAGNHHLICFSADKNPVIYVFNPQLQPFASHEVELKLNIVYDIRILPFSDHYLLYFHSPGATQHFLFDVKADGTSSDISSCLDRESDSIWNRSRATYQLLNQNEQLCILSHTYYETIKNVGSTLVRLDRDYKAESYKRVLFPFDKKSEILSQVSVEGNYLMVLKIRLNDEWGHELRILKINMSNGKSHENFFDAGHHLYMNAAIRYNLDSTVLISAMVRQPAGSVDVQRVVFLTHLGDTLQQLAPISLLGNQFKKNTSDNFLLVGEKQQTWLHMGIADKVKSPYINRNYVIDYGIDERTIFNIRDYENENRMPVYEKNDFPKAIRLSMLNKQLKTVRDSIIANGKDKFDVLPKPFASFEMNQKAYLVLMESFTPQTNGLLIVGTDNKNVMTSRELPVYERYNYNLSLLKPVGDEYVIMPFTYKNEIGLVKIIMKN